MFVASVAPRIKGRHELVKDTVLWEIEHGGHLTATQIIATDAKRTELYHRMRRFMERYDAFVLPSTQVLPFDVNEHYVKTIEGVELETYIDWMKSCYFISIVGNPAISVPCGFTPEGLPVGLQIVGRHRDDWGVLQIAHAFERAAALPPIQTSDQVPTRPVHETPDLVSGDVDRAPLQAALRRRDQNMSRYSVRSTSSLCSPSSGARRETSVGVALILIGDPSVRRRPSVG